METGMPIERLPSQLSHRDLGLFAGTKPLGKRTRRGRTASYPGIFASTKCLGPAVFDSLLEKDFQTVLCADPRIEGYAVQSHRLIYWTPNQDGTNTQRTYTPDLVVRLKTGANIVIEVKSLAFVSRSYWVSRVPFIRAAYEKEYATRFLVVSEPQIRIQPRLANYKLLLRYGARATDAEADTLVRDTIARIPHAPTVGEICESVPLIGKRMARAYAAVLRQHLCGAIKLDLDVPLSPSTTIIERQLDV